MEHFPIRSWTVRARPSAAAPLHQLSPCFLKRRRSSNSSYRKRPGGWHLDPQIADSLFIEARETCSFDKELAACPIATWLFKCRAGG